MLEKGRDFGVPRRQHAVGLLVLVFWQGRMLLRASWPLLIAAYVQHDEDVWFFLWAMIGAAVLTVVGGILHFWRFTFNIKDGKFHVHKGVLVREKINIPLERVQAVHVEQNLIQRLFGVCGLRVDTAGSTGTELRIHALTWDEAQSMRAMLSSQQPLASADAKAETSTAIFELDARTLVQVGISQNHMAKVAFAIGGLVTFQGLGWEVVGEIWGRIPGLWRTVMVFLSPLLFLMSPVIIASVAVLLSLVTTLLRHWRMRLWVEGAPSTKEEAIHLTQGLLNRQSMQVPIHKVQWVMWENTWIRRMLGMDTMHIRQASAGGAVEMNDGGSSMKMMIPAMNGARTRKIEALLFPSWPERKLTTLRPAPVAFWLRWASRGLMLTPLAFWAGWAWGIGWGLSIGMLWWTWVGWISHRVIRGLWATTDGRHLSVHQGWLFRKRVMMDWTKLQAVQFTQNRIHARRGIAHLTFHTSSGVSQLRYLPVEQARSLRDMAQARVLAHRGPWM